MDDLPIGTKLSWTKGVYTIKAHSIRLYDGRTSDGYYLAEDKDGEVVLNKKGIQRELEEGTVKEV